MAMVPTKVSLIAGVLLTAALSCSPRGGEFSWQALPIDGHRTGVSAPLADNVGEALGTFDGSVYVAPNGNRFRSGSTPAVAARMIEVQPKMASLKEVVAYSEKEMTKFRPESELSNFAVDVLMAQTEKITGRKVDVGLLNFGGIRVNMPKGPVILDDIVSMFPFKNYVTYLTLPGSELRRVFEQMARGKVEVIGGARLRIRDGKLVSVTVGGRPLSDSKSYGVATIDFLLDGGDNLKLARGCKEMLITEVKLVDAILPYIREVTARGDTLRSSLDGRVIIEEEGK